MKLVYFEVYGLNSRNSTIKISFKEDITVLIGRNGSGKTTIMKLVWFMVSGNLERIQREIDFSYAKLETDRYQVEYRFHTEQSEAVHRGISNRVVRRTAANNKKFSVVYTAKKDGILSDSQLNFDSSNAEMDINEVNLIIASAGASVFFPTFRRFEGGYSINNQRTTDQRRPNPRPGINSLNEIVSEISDTISVMNHKFVISFSASDISQMVANRFTKVSTEYQKSQETIGKTLIEEIREYKRGKTRNLKYKNSDQLIDSIEVKINLMEEERIKVMLPIWDLQEYIGLTIKKSVNILEYNHIDIKDSVPMDLLSAGEKQMLSFLCYNAFYDEIPIFIDEPELSLNGDWQRILFSTLLRQNPTNQYIISTHSPFIYSRYKDKTINLNEFGELGE